MLFVCLIITQPRCFLHQCGIAFKEGGEEKRCLHNLADLSFFPFEDFCLACIVALPIICNDNHGPLVVCIALETVEMLSGVCVLSESQKSGRQFYEQAFEAAYVIGRKGYSNWL